MQPVIFLGKTVAGKSRGSPEMKMRYEVEEAKQYRKTDKRIKKSVRKVKGSGKVLSSRRLTLA